MARRLLIVAPPVAITVAVVLLLGHPAVARGAAADARQTYLADCAVCHGADAHGTDRGPTLQGAGGALIDYEISTGRMPISEPDDRIERRAPKYDTGEQQALVAYVASLTGPGPDIPAVDLASADVARGGIAFREQCAACHAWSGAGGALLEREAPGLTKATPTQIAEAIRTGPGSMPVFGTAALTDQGLSDTVAFVDSLKEPDDRGGLSLGHLGPVPEGALAIVGGLGLLLCGARWIGSDR